MVLNIAQNLNILYVCPNIANINCWKLLLFRTYKCRIWFLFVLGIIKESEDRMSICYSLTLILWMRCTIAMHLCLRSVLLSSSRQVTGLGLINSQLLLLSLFSLGIWTSHIRWKLWQMYWQLHFVRMEFKHQIQILSLSKRFFILAKLILIHLTPELNFVKAPIKIWQRHRVAEICSPGPHDSQ